MNRTVVRRAVVALPILALAVAGCSIHEQTQTWYAPADGVNAEAGSIGLRNVLVVSDGDEATVLASMANSGTTDDELVGVTIGDVAAAPAEPVAVPGNGYASVGYSQNHTRVDVTGAEADPGSMVTLEFQFAAAPRVEVDAFVRPASGVYADALDEFSSHENAAAQDG